MVFEKGFEFCFLFEQLKNLHFWSLCAMSDCPIQMMVRSVLTVTSERSYFLKFAHALQRYQIFLFYTIIFANYFISRNFEKLHWKVEFRNIIALIWTLIRPSPLGGDSFPFVYVWKWRKSPTTITQGAPEKCKHKTHFFIHIEHCTKCEIFFSFK